jgi:hypothetical protein
MQVECRLPEKRLSVKNVLAWMDPLDCWSEVSRAKGPAEIGEATGQLRRYCKIKRPFAVGPETGQSAA